MTLSTVSRYDPDALSSVGSHAVVVGAGMAGLMAARVLADGFDKVTLLDRDPLPDRSAPRRGTPQAHHVHAMLEAGRATLEDLFPGYGAAVLAAGGTQIDITTDLDYYHEGDFLAAGAESIPMLCATRPLFEAVARRRVAALDSVVVRPETPVVSYCTDSESTVTGVTIRADGDEETLPADLVVDATGRTSRTPDWLDRHGYPVPDLEEVHVDLAYTTVAIERPPDAQYGYLVSPSPSLPRGGTVIPVEDDRWLVTLFGFDGDHPPMTADAFHDFAVSLPTPAIAELLETNSLVSTEFQQYPFPASRRYAYEDLSRFPDGLVVLGDAIASFNPIYGQGMSVAALEAVHLHHALANDGVADLAPRFFARVADVLDIVWRMTVGADFGFPWTDGSKPLGTDLFNKYLSCLIRTGHSDRHVADAFTRVLLLEQPPSTLFTPSILLRVVLPSIP